MRNKKLIVLVSILIILSVAVVTPALALLLHNTSVDVDVAFGSIQDGEVEVTQQRVDTANFVYPGDKNTYTYTVTNNGSMPMNYNFSLSMTNGGDSPTAALLIYFDGEYLGTVADLAAGRQEGANDAIVIDINKSHYINNKIIVSPTAKHTLVIEYHNGAQGSFNDGKEVVFNTTFHAYTIDYKSDLVVDSYDGLVRTVQDVNTTELSRTIRLNGMITLGGDIAINRSTCIDFTSGGIDFNGYRIFVGNTLLSATELKLITNKPLSNIGVVSGSITVVSNLAHVNLGKGMDNISTAIIATELNVDAVTRMLASEITVNMARGFVAGQSSYMLGANRFYLADNRIADIVNLLPDISGYSYDNGSITLPISSTSYSTRLELVGRDVNIRVLGGNYLTDSGYIYDIIINEELKHIDYLTVEKSNKLISYNIFLPTSITKYNALIEWQSDNPKILSDSGVCGDNVEGRVVLTAIITINGDVFTVEYNLQIAKQSNQMKFDYLVARIGEPELGALYDASKPDKSFFILPIVSSPTAADDYRYMFNMEPLGLESIRYKLSTTYTYISNIRNNMVTLDQYTFETYAEIKIYAKFLNEADKEYEAIIPIKIKPIDNGNVHEIILKMIQEQLNSLDILQLILDSRKQLGVGGENGAFELMGYYKGFKIDYSFDEQSPDGSVTLVDDVNSINRKYIITPDISKLSLVKPTAIINVTIVYENNLDGKTTAPLKFNLPKALNTSDLIANGGANNDMFYSLRLQVMQQLRGANGVLDEGVPQVTESLSVEAKAMLDKSYILLTDMIRASRIIIAEGGSTYTNNPTITVKDSDSDYYYFHINSMVSYSIGLDNLSQLTDIRVVSGVNLVGSSVEGAAIFNYIFQNYLLLTRLDMVNCRLINVDNMAYFKYLVSINFSSNPIANYDWINRLYSSNVHYINLSGTLLQMNTNVNNAATITINGNAATGLSTHEGYIASAYYRYILSNNVDINNATNKPTYYYDNDTLYIPRYSILELEYISYISSIKVSNLLNSNALHLILHVHAPPINNTPRAIAVTWEPIEAAYVDYIKLEGSTTTKWIKNLKFIQDTIPTVNEYHAQIKASITATTGNTSLVFTRTFPLKVMW